MDPLERRSSTASFNDRKRSSQIDRLHRQARQSILFEERSSPVFRDDLFSSLPIFKPSGVVRRPTSELSPTDDPHPGTRVPETSHTWKSRRESLRGLSEIFPIPRPPRTQSTATQRKGSIAVPLATLDEDAVEAQRIEIDEIDEKDASRGSLFARLGSLVPRSNSIRPGAISGLQIAAAAATAHAKATLQHQSYLHSARQQVYITEYSGDSSKPTRIPMTLNSISGIQHYLLEASKARYTQPSLRVIYVQNNDEAMDFLTNVFRLDHPSFENFEGSFKDWLHESRTHRGKLARTVSWKSACDLARDVSCTLFGLDLGSSLGDMQSAPDISLPGKKQVDPRLLTRGISTSRPQRLSVYMQRKLNGFPDTSKMTMFNTSAAEQYQCAHQNTILIYENSHDDCEEIIQGPGLLDIEWRDSTATLTGASSPFLSRPSSPPPIPTPNSTLNSEAALLATMETILLHVFTKILRAWRKQFALLSIQHSQLEDRVYGQPSDDTHAPQLWAMSKYLWGMAKLVNRHSNLLEDVQDNFNVFAERTGEGDSAWLEDVLRDFRQASITIQEDFIRPTEHMIDLVYKSVSIRDSRQSLELNTSLWRLSWVTFIFLPLTFLAGFFGMNVSIFSSDPSVKYYFIAAVPLMTVMLLILFAVRQYGPKDRQFGVGESMDQNKND